MPWHDHLGAVFTITLCLPTIFGTSYIAVRTALSLRRLRKLQKVEATRRRDSAETGEGSEAEEEELSKGGARRLRMGLVVCLLGSDGLIALSSIGPAFMGLAGVPLRDGECDPAGLILAMGLWWQYGFSLVIAATTYLALRHPLSACKRIAEKRSSWIVVFVLVVGAVQAFLWRYLHGYVEWRDYCFYGPPSSHAAELFQFIPRLISSLAIALIYLPLIHFLRRPDLSALYLSPRPASLALAPTPSNDIPPWERLSFPNFNGLGLSALEDLRDDPTGPSSGENSAGAGMSAEASTMAPSVAAVFLPVPVPTLPKPVPAYLGAPMGSHGSTPGVDGVEWYGRTDRMDRGSMMSERTLVPSLKVQIIGSDGRGRSLRSDRFNAPLPAADDTPSSSQGESFTRKGSFSKASIRSGISARSSIRKAFRSRSTSPAPSPTDTLPPPSPKQSPKVKVLVCVCSRSPSSSAPTSPDVETGSFLGPNGFAFTGASAGREKASGSTTPDYASFRGMLDYVPCQIHPRSASGGSGSGVNGWNGVGGDGRPCTPTRESMASFMKRRTSTLLIWFPLTHLVICSITLARFITYSVTKRDDSAIEALSLISLLGQGFADVIVFGFLERCSGIGLKWRPVRLVVIAKRL